MSEQRSIFGGHDLQQIKNAEQEVIQKLRELGVTDIEQALAILSNQKIADNIKGYLGLSDDELNGLIGEFSREIGARSAEAATSGTTLNYQRGALPPTPEMDLDNQSIASTPPVALPPNVNHSKLMPPIRNQGGRGTCVAFAITAVHEFYRKMSGSPQDFSEQFLYCETKLIDGAPKDCGTWQTKAAQVLQSIGECRENVWQYNPYPPCNNNGVEPTNAHADAAQFKLPTVTLNPRDLNGIKNALAQGSVVGFSIPVYDSWYNSSYVQQTGRINMRVGSEPVDGGHAMCLVGYQDDTTVPGGGFFILRNSWDTTWGSQCLYGAGNGTIPYAYLATDCWEAVTTLPPKPHAASIQQGSASASLSADSSDDAAPGSQRGMTPPIGPGMPAVAGPGALTELNDLGTPNVDFEGRLHSLTIPSLIAARISAVPNLPPFSVQWYYINHGPEYVFVSANYSAHIYYRDHGRNDVSQTLQFTAATLTPTFNFGGRIIGGVFSCTCSINWRRTTDGHTGTTAPATSEWGILGDNPLKANVRAMLSDRALQVIAYKESRFRHFDNQGLPLFGPPRGFGVMQLDTPPPSTQQVWDWKQNVAGGIALYNKKKQEVSQHFQNIYTANPGAPHLSDEQFRLALYQYYNGGFYWDWDGATKTWKKVGVTAYGDDAMRIEKLVAAGTPPGDWN